MKKILATIILIGASAAYLFSRQGDEAPPVALTTTAGSAAGGITVSPAPQAGAATPPVPSAKSGYKDGTYTGSIADAYYGPVEVKADIKSGALDGVSFVLFPNGHQTSVYINDQAMPLLTQEAISAQSANVNSISGATFTSAAFEQSLASALKKARNS